jgi:hypothetical protein
MKKVANKLHQNISWATFWAILSRAHLATLLPSLMGTELKGRAATFFPIIRLAAS